MYSGVGEIAKMLDALVTARTLSIAQEDALSVVMGNHMGKEENNIYEIASLAKAIEPMVREIALLRALSLEDESTYIDEESVNISYCKKVRGKRPRIIDDEDVQWSEGYDEMLALKDSRTTRLTYACDTTNKYIHMIFDFTLEDE